MVSYIMKNGVDIVSKLHELAKGEVLHLEFGNTLKSAYCRGWLSVEPFELSLMFDNTISKWGVPTAYKVGGDWIRL